MKINNVNPLSNIQKSDRIDLDSKEKDISSKINDKLDISNASFKDASITSLKKIVLNSEIESIEKIKEIQTELKESFKDGKMSIDTAEEIAQTIKNLI